MSFRTNRISCLKNSLSSATPPPPPPPPLLLLLLLLLSFPFDGMAVVEGVVMVVAVIALRCISWGTREERSWITGWKHQGVARKRGGRI
jgi:hypothetical protein